VTRTVSRLICAAVLAMVVVPASAFAQTPGARLPVAHKQLISGNPFLIMAKYFNVEYERKHTETRTFGVSASAFGVDDTDYRNVQLFYRYYPQGAALTGFYVGGRAGVHRVSHQATDGSAAGVGFELGYSWLLGENRNFAISLGAGATRLFGGSLDDVSLFVPTIRLVNIGWSF
jgi:hypothetical protein